MNLTNFTPLSFTPRTQVNESPVGHLRGEVLYIIGDTVISILGIPDEGVLEFDPKAEIEIGDRVGVTFNLDPRFGFLAQAVSPDCYRIDPVDAERKTLFVPSSVIHVEGKFTRAKELMSFLDVQIPSAN